MRRNRLSPDLTFTWAKHRRTHEGNHTTDGVDDIAAREIEEALLEQPATAPYPVNNYRVDEDNDNSGIDDVADKVSALCHCTSCNCTGCRGERELKEEHRQNTNVIWREQGICRINTRCK